MLLEAKASQPNLMSCLYSYQVTRLPGYVSHWSVILDTTSEGTPGVCFLWLCLTLRCLVSHFSTIVALSWELSTIWLLQLVVLAGLLLLLAL